MTYVDYDDLPEEAKKFVDDPLWGGNTWDHALLAIYEPEGGWPAEGTKADWVGSGKVAFHEEGYDTLIGWLPFREILKWKWAAWKETLQVNLHYWLFHKLMFWRPSPLEELEKWFKDEREGEE